MRRSSRSAKMNAAAEADAAAQAAAEQAKAQADADKELAKQQAAAAKAEAAAEKERQREYDRIMKSTGGTTRTSRKKETSPLEQVLNSKSTQTILNSVIRGIFGTGRR